MAKGKYAEWLEAENLIRLEGWARDGLTNEQIAHNMGIGERTLYEWMDKYPQIMQTLKRGKEVVDREVENALYKSAIGYSVDECTYERRFNRKTGEYEMVCTKKVTKHIQPSNTAQIYWLKNRKPDVWRDKQAEESNAAALGKLDEILGVMRNEAIADAE